MFRPIGRLAGEALAVFGVVLAVGELALPEGEFDLKVGQITRRFDLRFVRRPLDEVLVDGFVRCGGLDARQIGGEATEADREGIADESWPKKRRAVHHPLAGGNCRTAAQPGVADKQTILSHGLMSLAVGPDNRADINPKAGVGDGEAEAGRSAF